MYTSGQKSVAFSVLPKVQTAQGFMIVRICIISSVRTLLLLRVVWGRVLGGGEGVGLVLLMRGGVGEGYWIVGEGVGLVLLMRGGVGEGYWGVGEVVGVVLTHWVCVCMPLPGWLSW